MRRSHQDHLEALEAQRYPSWRTPLACLEARALSPWGAPRVRRVRGNVRFPASFSLSQFHEGPSHQILELLSSFLSFETPAIQLLLYKGAILCPGQRDARSTRASLAPEVVRNLRHIVCTPQWSNESIRTAWQGPRMCQVW